MTSLEQKMLDCSTGMVMLVDPVSQRILVHNRAVCQTLGYAPEEMAALSISDIESSLQDVFYWQSVAAGQLENIDWQDGVYRRQDGSLIDVSKSVTRIDHDGQSYLLIQARDVREEHKVEEVLDHTLSQLRATLEATGNGLLVIDWQGSIASMNRTFSQMWAVPEEMLKAKDDAAILAHLRERTIEGEQILARLQAIVDGDESEEIFHLQDGRILECKSRPQVLGERIIGRVFSFADITPRMRAEQALRETLDALEARVATRTAELRAANEKLQKEQVQQLELIAKLNEAQNQLLQSEKMAAIGQLAAGVAHEINNPVGFVKSNLATLKQYHDSLWQLLDTYQACESGLDEATRERLRALKQTLDLDYLREDLETLLVETRDGVQRVQDIVRDLKNFSHVDSSEIEMAQLESGLDSTLNVVWNELKYKAQVAKEYAGLPMIPCSPSQLNQVFMNLLVNAAQAMRDFGQITIRTGFDEREVWVEIEDDGQGIPPENIERIFDPFFTTKPVGKGTGLGLSLSYGIVKKHQGRIEVRSDVGQGTTFRVVLPREQQAEPAA